MVQPVVWRDRQTVNQVNTSTDSHFDPRVIQLANGNVLIAYTSTSTTGAGSPAGTDVVGTLYDSRGNVLSEIRLNFFSTSSDEFDFEVTALADGGFAVAYYDDSLTNNDQSIRFDRYNAAGTILDSESVVTDSNGDTGDPFYRNPHVASQSGASTLVTYEVHNGASAEIRARLYNGTSFGAEIDLTNSFSTSGLEGLEYSLAVLSSGAYVLAIANRNGIANDQIQILRLNTDGTPIGFPTTIFSALPDSYSPHVVALNDGRFIVTWVTDGSGGTDTGIRGMIFNNDGTLDRDVFTPATTTAGNQLSPVAAALPGGAYVVVWIDAGTYSIRGQAYAADGTPDGGEFFVADFANNSIGEVDVQGLDDGRFVVTWEVSISGDIRVERAIMDPRNQENSPNVYTTDQIIGTINGDIIEVAHFDDQVFGWNGNDRFRYNSPTDINSGDVYDGGSGTDALVISGGGTFDFRTATITSFSELEFSFGGNNVVQFDSSQIGNSGLSASATIDGFFDPGISNVIEVYLTSQNSVDLSLWVITDWRIEDDEIIIYGNANANTIRGSDTVDSMRGGAGSDIYYVNTFLDRVIELPGEGSSDIVFAAGSYTLTPGAEVEALAAENFLDASVLSLVGNEYGQDLYGNQGDNTLVGGGGVDGFAGYGGNDIYVVDNAAEVITEEAGNGTDSVYTTVSYSLAVGLSIERLVAAPLASTNTVNLTGNELGQVIVGNNGVNTINGAAGNDSIYGYGGNDYLEGAQGNDSLFGGTGVDRFVFRESLGAASGIDRIYDMTASDNIVIDALAVSSLTSLTANQFRLGTAAGDADDRIIYDATSGVFWFDPDGTGAQAAILFGVINGAPGGVDHTWFELM